MSNILYVKKFDNGKMYVGITNNFDRRMYMHQWEAYSKNSQLLVHKAMRKYSHTTEIWAECIDDRDLIYMLEAQTIKQLKDEGIELYNMTDGGLDEMGTTYGMSGQLNPNSKSIEYHATKDTTRRNFRRTCDRNGWNFEDFEEIFSRRVARKDGIRKDTYYTYKKREDW